MRFVYGISAMICWFFMSVYFFTNTFGKNPELFFLTTAIVFAGAMAGGD